MDSVDVETIVYLPPAAVYEFLEDFPRYAQYSKHLREVRVVDQGETTDRASGDSGAASRAVDQGETTDRASGDSGAASRVVDQGETTDRASGDDERAGDPTRGPGTVYELTFAWWKLTYTARSEVTDVDPPTRIDWRITKDFVASGYWLVEATEPPAGREHASRVTFHVDFRPETADDDMLSLPRFVSLDWVIGKVKPKVIEEAERVVRRIVADLEGESRDVDLEIRTDTRL